MAAHLLGEDDVSDEIRQRLFHQYLDDNDTAGAARAAFFVGMSLMLRGEPAQGGAWIGRASDMAADLDGAVITSWSSVPSGRTMRR